MQAAVDNALVGLKNTLLSHVCQSYDSTPEVAESLLSTVCTVLEYNRTLFGSLSYDYKLREIAERVMQAVAEQVQRFPRKNSKYRESFSKILVRATELRYH